VKAVIFGALSATLRQVLTPRSENPVGAAGFLLPLPAPFFPLGIKESNFLKVL